MTKNKHITFDKRLQGYRLKYGIKYEKTGVESDWIKVVYNDGKDGYIKKNDLSEFLEWCFLDDFEYSLRTYGRGGEMPAGAYTKAGVAFILGIDIFSEEYENFEPKVSYTINL